MDLGSPYPLYFFVYIIVGISILLIWRILNSPFGRLLQAIRENEERTIASGYNVTMAKFVSLVFSGLFSALAGGLFTVYLGYGPLHSLYWLTSGTILLMTILGGMHTFIGPVVGVAVFLYVQNQVQPVYRALGTARRHPVHRPGAHLPGRDRGNHQKQIPGTKGRRTSPETEPELNAKTEIEG